MIARICRLTAAEFLKLFSQPFLYFALAALLASTLLAEVFQPLVSGQKETAWRSFNSIQLFAYGFKFGIKIATFVLLIFSSMMFAGEFDRGTIKNLLTRPLTRGEFFLAKCLTVTSLAVLLYGWVFYVSAAYALARGQLGPIWDDTQYLMMRDYAEISAHAWKACWIGFLPFLAVGFFGILVSNLTESSGYAVAIALVLFLFGDVATGWMRDTAQQKVFLYYGSYGMDKLRLFSEGGTARWNPDIDRRVLYVTVPLASIAAFIPAAFGIFRSRNIIA